jgi:hypothetical protein
MEDYKLLHGNLYGSLVRENGEVVTVPYLIFKQTLSGRLVRIPQEVFNNYSAQGFNTDHILKNYGQWYCKIRAKTIEREKERLKNQPKVHSLYDLILVMETRVSDELWTRVINEIRRVKEEEERPLTIDEFIWIFPEMLQYVITLRVLNDEKNGDCPQDHLDRYCEQVVEVKEDEAREVVNV